MSYIAEEISCQEKNDAPYIPFLFRRFILEEKMDWPSLSIFFRLFIRVYTFKDFHPLALPEAPQTFFRVSG
jgi:hypothetical protein